MTKPEVTREEKVEILEEVHRDFSKWGLQDRMRIIRAIRADIEATGEDCRGEHAKAELLDLVFWLRANLKESAQGTKEHFAIAGLIPIEDAPYDKPTPAPQGETEMDWAPGACPTCGHDTSKPDRDAQGEGEIRCRRNTCMHVGVCGLRFQTEDEADKGCLTFLNWWDRPYKATSQDAPGEGEVDELFKFLNTHAPWMFHNASDAEISVIKSKVEGRLQKPSVSREWVGNLKELFLEWEHSHDGPVNRSLGERPQDEVWTEIEDTFTEAGVEVKDE